MTNKPQFVGERVKLGDVVAAVPGRNADLHCNAVYSVTNSQGFVPSEEYFSKDVFSKDLKSYRVVKRNMIAYNPSRINVGSVALQDKEDEVVVSPLYVIFSTDERKVLPDYVVRFLKSKPGLDQIAFRSIGTVRNNLKFKALCQMTIKLPSLEEQQSRLSNLRSIQNQIDRANRQLAALDSLVKSRFVEMFGDPAGVTAKQRLVSIGSFTDVQTGATPLRKEPKYYGGSIPWVKTGEVARNFANGVEESITDIAIRETNCKVFPAGTILVAMYGQGDTRGKAAILPFEAATNQACAAIVPSPSHDESFLNAQLQLLYEKMRARSLGGNQKNLSLGIIKSMKVLLPSMEAQNEFADFVAQVDKSRFLHQASAKVRGNKLQSSFTSDIGSTFSRRLSLQEGLTLG